MKRYNFLAIGVVILLVVGFMLNFGGVSSASPECMFLQVSNRSGSTEVSSMVHSFSGTGSAPYCEYLKTKTSIENSNGTLIYIYQIYELPETLQCYLSEEHADYTIKLYSDKVLAPTNCQQ